MRDALTDAQWTNLRSDHLQWIQGAKNGRRADLKRQDLRERELSGVNLRGADLAGAVLAGSQLQWTDLRNANLDGADLSGCRLLNVNLSGASLVGANLQGAEIVTTVPSLGGMTATNLAFADLTDVRLCATLNGTNFSGAILTEADLSGSQAEGYGASFKRAILERTNFAGIPLRNVDFTFAELIDADFSDADISHCEFHHADLIRVSFRRARIKASGFVPSYFEALDLTQTVFQACRHRGFFDDLQSADRKRDSILNGTQFLDIKPADQPFLSVRLKQNL